MCLDDTNGMAIVFYKSVLCLFVESQQANLYLDKLTELEAALQQRRANAEFNVPVVAIYGIEKQGERTNLVEEVVMAQDSSNDTEVQADDDDDVSQIDEDSDILDLMEELEDSTESPQWG